MRIFTVVSVVFDTAVGVSMFWHVEDCSLLDQGCGVLREHKAGDIKEILILMKGKLKQNYGTASA